MPAFPKILTLLLDVAKIQIRQEDYSLLLHAESIVLDDLPCEDDSLYCMYELGQT
jgi:hypothetical protein